MELTSELTEDVAQMQEWSEAARVRLLVSLLFLTDDVVPAVPHSGPYLCVFFGLFFCFCSHNLTIFSSRDESAHYVVN